MIGLEVESAVPPSYNHPITNMLRNCKQYHPCRQNTDATALSKFKKKLSKCTRTTRKSGCQHQKSMNVICQRAEFLSEYQSHSRPLKPLSLDASWMILPVPQPYWYPNNGQSLGASLQYQCHPSSLNHDHELDVGQSIAIMSYERAP